MIEKLGRFEIVAELGQGAMGTVYKARDPMLDRIVAIKTISLSLPADEVAEYKARFYQEAKAAGQLSHPNIVTIYDIGNCSEVAYMAMEYLEGEELRRILGSGSHIPIEQALDIGAQVADALEYAHERDVVHRDIKPANVMVLTDGSIKLTDFGIARMRNNEIKTMTGMILGSPKYMAPEQVAGKRADARSDLFSLGVVIYEMLTGTSPFVADNIHGVMYQTLNFNPPAPTGLNPRLPDVVNYIIAKVLAKGPEDRYQTAADLANDLRQARDEFLANGTHADAAAACLSDTAPPAHPAQGRALEREAAKEIITTAGTDPTVDRAPRDYGTNTDEMSNPALRLSEAFDSTEATNRLAVLDGTEDLTRELSDTQKVERLKMLASNKLAPQEHTISTSSTWSNHSAAARMSGMPGHLDGRLRLIWVANALLLAAAVLIILLR